MAIADIQISPAVLRLDPTSRTGAFTVTVSNQLGRDGRLAVSILPMGAGRGEWFRIEERFRRLDLRRDETTVFDVVVTVPPEVGADTVGFKISCADDLDPQNVVVVSEQRDVVIPAPVITNGGRGRRFYFMLAAAGVLIIGGAVAAALLLSDDTPKPPPTPCPGGCPTGSVCNAAGVCEPVPIPPKDSGSCAVNSGSPCGDCGGTITCAGTCSRPNPPNFGQGCGKCGGTVTCEGNCSKSDPGNQGQPCGSCGGTIDCSGQCTPPTPQNFGTPCGPCGATIGCHGQCVYTAPANHGQSCGPCGATIGCSGDCIRPQPAFGLPCGKCGGTTLCDGNCSKPTPADHYEVTIKHLQTDSITCCWINEVRTYGSTCDPGHMFGGVELRKVSPGKGHCDLEEAGSGRSCRVRVRWRNEGTDGANCEIKIKQRRVCDE